MGAFITPFGVTCHINRVPPVEQSMTWRFLICDALVTTSSLRLGNVGCARLDFGRCFHDAGATSIVHGKSQVAPVHVHKWVQLSGLSFDLQLKSLFGLIWTIWTTHTKYDRVHVTSHGFDGITEALVAAIGRDQHGPSQFPVHGLLTFVRVPSIA